MLRWWRLPSAPRDDNAGNQGNTSILRSDTSSDGRDARVVYLFLCCFPQNIWRYGLNLPSILATSACLASSFILPSKLKGVADEITAPRAAAAAAAAVAVGKSPDDDDGESRRARRRLLDVEDINWAGRKGCIFFTLWFVAGVSFSICLGIYTAEVWAR